MAKPRVRRSRLHRSASRSHDEAGRGPAVGPMVMAAVALDSRSAATLTRAGLCDSKTYGAGDDATPSAAHSPRRSAPALASCR